MFYRQGDILFESIKELPKRIGKGAKMHSIVLAEGEFTGHSHTLQTEAPVTFYGKEVMVEEPRYIVVGSPVTIRHQEHRAIKLPKGKYKVTVEKEFDYFSETTRSQQD